MPPSLESVLRLTTAEDELLRQEGGCPDPVWLWCVSAIVLLCVIGLLNSPWFRRQG